MLVLELRTILKQRGCNLRLEQEFYLKVHRPIQLTFLGWQLCNGNCWRNSVFFGLYFYDKTLKNKNNNVLFLFLFFKNFFFKKKKRRKRIVWLGWIIPILDMSTLRGSKNRTLNTPMVWVKYLSSGQVEYPLSNKL